MPPRCNRRSEPSRPTLHQALRLGPWSPRKSARSYRNSSSTPSPRARPIAITGSAAGRRVTTAANYRVRTVANYAGIWANTPDEVLYFIATRDANEQTLSGSNSYVMHFAADRLPETVVDAFWPVILVGVPDYRVVPNPLNRFHLNNFSPLRKEADGSLKIAVGPKPVAGVPESNWLPSPEGKPFSLTFRTYVPKDVVRRGEWTPPPVTRLVN